ncbi:hypothetical protein CBS101457_005074 [Exobasidium rhododendri]|nr:hypothetical protein CBS101457_005074 [Exobasidium rhododendri]
MHLSSLLFAVLSILATTIAAPTDDVSLTRRANQPDMKPCRMLDDQARRDVLHSNSYQYVDTINAANGFRSKYLSWHSDPRPGVFGLYLKAEADAPQVSVFSCASIVNVNENDGRVMFWLAKGDECRITNKDLGTFSDESAVIYKKVK